MGTNLPKRPRRELPGAGFWYGCGSALQTAAAFAVAGFFLGPLAGLLLQCLAAGGGGSYPSKNPVTDFILVPQSLDLAGQFSPVLGGTGRRNLVPQQPGTVGALLAESVDLRRQFPAAGLHLIGGVEIPVKAEVHLLQRALHIAPDRFDLGPVDGCPGIRLGLHLVPEIEILPAQVGLAEEFVQQPLAPHLGPGTAGGMPGTVIPAEQAVIVGAELVVVGVQYPGQRWPVELRAQAMHPHRAATVHRTQGGVLAALLPPPQVAHPTQGQGKVLLGAGLLEGGAQCLPHPVVPGGFTPAFRFVEVTRYAFALGLYHRQPLCPAEGVGSAAQFPVLAAALLVLFAIHVGHRVDDKVVVQAVGVHVGGHQHLKPSAPHLPGQLHPDGVALFRGYLAGLETLVGVHRHHALGLAELPLHRPHIRPGGFGAAMNARHQMRGFLQGGLGVVPGVVQRLGQGAVFGFLWVGSIVHHPAQVVPYRPDLGDGQGLLLRQQGIPDLVCGRPAGERVLGRQTVRQRVQFFQSGKQRRGRMKLRRVPQYPLPEIFRQRQTTAPGGSFHPALFSRCHPHVDAHSAVSHEAVSREIAGFGVVPVGAAVSAAAKGCPSATQSPCSLP